MTNQFFTDFGKTFRQIRDDINIRVVVLSANGRIFSAGLDLMEAANMLSATGSDAARTALLIDSYVEPF